MSELVFSQQVLSFLGSEYIGLVEDNYTNEILHEKGDGNLFETISTTCLQENHIQKHIQSNRKGLSFNCI